MLALLAACQGREPTIADDPAGTPAGAPVGEAWTVGLNDVGQLGRAQDEDLDVAVAPAQGPDGTSTRMSGIAAVAAGSRHSLALTTQGRVYAWGSNSNGQLGDGTRTRSAKPVAVLAADGAAGELGDVVAIAANGGFSMALRKDGTVVTWGAGGNGQRGIGKISAPRRPTTVRGPDGVGPLQGVAAIAAGHQSEFAVLRDGSVLAWGSNRTGTLGVGGTAKEHMLPTPVKGPGGSGKLTGVGRLSVGNKHVLALLKDGRVLTWGGNELGQLGTGTQTPRDVPGPVVGEGGTGELRDIVAIAAGSRHSYAVRRDGTVVAWGDNSSGQVGDGTTTTALRPVPVVGAYTPTLRGVTSASAGQGFGVALLSNGTALTWGSAGKGQLGAGNRLSRVRPGPLVLSQGHTGRILAASAGDRHLVFLIRP